MATFTLVVTTPPHQNRTATVVEIAHALLNKGHQINGIFFYQDGVLNASKTLVMPSDEYQSIKSLAALANSNKVPMHLCITAAEKRGLTDEDSQHNILNFFTISGLGEMVELNATSDRVIQL
ncbi:sulfurtransferase complex subunit TusD [Thalassotalea sp. M1531]|uniref:Sulfurtransferase complex subunit TusD n=1 Tax=Thalassotalea algicola TaxID=2716224 RepID=A0A7Y0LDS1_9GAMM|nr:sulfurtransferase complex subunit TusD [Thalassotalea algicola]NMP32324.1 sulfurtransferase complex subunit TusD [Thalassotalea algicola]